MAKNVADINKIDYTNIKASTTLEYFMSDKARTASVLNGLKTTHLMCLLAK
jgi:hypothetical protein